MGPDYALHDIEQAAFERMNTSMASLAVLFQNPAFFIGLLTD